MRLPLSEILEKISSNFTDLSFLLSDPVSTIANSVFCNKIEFTGNQESSKLGLLFGFEIYHQTEIKIPLLNGCSLTLGKGDVEFSALTLSAWADINELNNNPYIEVKGAAGLKISKDFFKPVIYRNNKWETDESPGRTALVLDLLPGLALKFNRENGVSLVDESSQIATININSSATSPQTGYMILESGIVIKDLSIGIVTNNNHTEIKVHKASIVLPEFFIIPNNTKVEFTDASISNSGFSGTCSVDIPLAANSNIFGIPGGLKHIEIVIENNQPTTLNLEGQLTIPYFEQPVAVKFNIDSNGCVSVTLINTSNKPITITKDELIALYIQSISLDCPNQSLTISGGLEPLLFAKEGVKWPRMDVKELQIDSSGHISIKEAWLDLKDLVNLDLFGFHFELRKIGIGTTNDDKMWVDISGAVKLIEQLPLGLDVEGFRLTWPSTLAFTPGMSLAELQQQLAKIEVQFQGVEINFAIPAVVKIDGLIRFFKEPQKVGFAGDMKLAVIPAGFTAEAGLMVGMNFEDPPFPFLYVYFGFESAAGIPLAQTGLALKGAIGLIGMNVEPNKTPAQHWYYDWYKGPPAPGVQQTTKWTDKRNAFAIGVGVTISTADGIVKKVQGLLVLAIPGPILVINGKAFLLDTGIGSGEPPFEALAVFDGNEGTVLFNVHAQAEIVKDMIDADAGVEAFFDFKDLTNWHLYIGQDQPEDRRIRANVMDIMTADAYLMLDMIDADSPRMRAGVSAKIEPEIPDLTVDTPAGEVGIQIDAWLNIEGDGEVSINPEQFSGNVSIDGGLTVDAFGLVFGPSVEAHLDFNGPSPFKLKGGLEFTLEMWPEDFHAEADFELEIPAPPELEIKNPVQTVSLFSRFTNESKEIPLFGDNFSSLPAPESEDEKSKAERSPVVQVDVNPVIAFNHEMNQQQGMHFLMHPNEFHPNTFKKYKAGEINLTPTVTIVEVFEKKKSNGWDTAWQKIYTTENPAAGQGLLGAWLTESDPQSPAQPASRKLQLLTDNPLINTAHSYLMEPGLFMTTTEPKDHLSGLLLNDYPGLMFERPRPKAGRCVSFCTADKKDIKIDVSKPFNFSGLLFTSNSLMGIDCRDTGKPDECCCLRVEENLEIVFPTEIAECSITYCDIPDLDGKPEIRYFLKDKESAILHADYNSLNDEKSTWYKSFTKDGFDRISIKGKNFSIRQICYKTKAELNSDAINGSTVDGNTGLENSNGNDSPHRIKPYLNPGCYYKVMVASGVHASNPSGLYHNVLSPGFYETDGKSFKAVAYFQTDSPPNNLSPYIKWTYPNQDLNRVYCNDEFAICFKRDYLDDLFSGTGDHLKNYKINAYVLDAQNKLLRRNITWEESGVFTLFPDEFTWEIHKNQYNLPLLSRKENLLIIKPQQPLLANQKYSLLLTGGDGGSILIPAALEKEDMDKFWKDPDTNWTYDNSKVFSAKTTGNKELLSIKEDYENIELTVEIKGSQFLLIFRNRKINTKDIRYWINMNLDLRTAELHAEGLYVRGNKSFVLPSGSLDPGAWVKFKLKVIGNLISLFLFEKTVINEFDLTQLLKVRTRIGNEEVEVDVEHNASGSAGIKASQAQFRNIQLRNAELLRIPFYSTGFNSITDIPAADFKTVEIPGDINLTASVFNQKYTQVANASLDFYKSSVDLDYGMAKYTNVSPSIFGREAVEKCRSVLRDHKAALDDHFNSTCVGLVGGEFFNEAKASCNVVGLKKKNADNSFDIKGFYIKLPEKLFLGTSAGNDPFKRTLFDKIKVNGSPVSFEMIFNSDGDQLILTLQNGIRIASQKKPVSFSFIYTPDFKDRSTTNFFEQSEIKHHRYDRPFTKKTDNTIPVTFTVQV